MGQIWDLEGSPLKKLVLQILEHIDAIHFLKLFLSIGTFTYKLSTAMQNINHYLLQALLCNLFQIRFILYREGNKKLLKIYMIQVQFYASNTSIYHLILPVKTAEVNQELMDFYVHHIFSSQGNKIPLVNKVYELKYTNSGKMT